MYPVLKKFFHKCFFHAIVRAGQGMISDSQMHGLQLMLEQPYALQTARDKSLLLIAIT
jgi:hypothetical protein